MNSLAHTTTITLGPPVVIENMTRVIIPSSETDLRSQSLHVEDKPIFRFDLEVGPSKPQGNYRLYQRQMPKGCLNHQDLYHISKVDLHGLEIGPSPLPS